MIDPDETKRRDGLRRLDVLAGAAKALGTALITLCTGTRDPQEMWKRHPENDEPSAWSDLVASMREAAAIADRHDVTFAFEPELGNVVDSAAKARRLLDEIDSPRLKVVLDVANLIRPGEIPRQAEILDEAFDLLAADVALVHIKEIGADGAVGNLSPGQGVLDLSRLFRRYHDAKMDAPVIIHGLPEDVACQALFHVLRAYTLEKYTTTFRHDGLAFRYLDIGGNRFPDGFPAMSFVFQHGLSGDLTKMHEIVSEQLPIRLLSFDARYHGKTRPLGPPEKIGFDQSAADLLALLDHLGIEKAVIGGLSMGAGIALNFAIRHPERTLALILSRPAWLDEPLPENVRMFPEIAAMLKAHGTAGREPFMQTETYARVLSESTDSASSIRGMFDDPIAVETVERFERIPRDCPVRDRASWRSIRVPTLVLANHQDPIHPFAIGEGLAAEIPGAQFATLTPKCVDVNRHNGDFNGHIDAFLTRHFRGHPTHPYRG